MNNLDESLKGYQAKIETLNSLLKLGRLINSTLDLNELLRLTMELATEVVKAESSLLVLKERFTEDLVAHVATGERGEIVKQIRIPKGKGIIGWVAENKKALLVNDVQNDPRFFREIDQKTGLKTRNVLCAPLLAEEKLVGVIEVVNKRDNGCFGEADVKMFEIFASGVAVAIENAMLHSKLQVLLVSTVEALSSIVDTKNPPGHSKRVMGYSLLIAEEMGLGKQEKENLKLVALLHDIGMVSIEDRIVSRLRRGILTDEEFVEFKKHPEYGVNIIRHIGELEPVVQGIWHHHERYNGDGYPGGLIGEGIPLISRIVALAEDFDTIMSNPILSQTFGLKAMLVEIEDSAGTKYDPEVCHAFKRLYEKGRLKEVEAQQIIEFV